MIFLILALFILKIAPFAELAFLYDTIVAVSLQIQTFMRIPFFVTIVAFLGLVSDAASSITTALIESATSVSCCAFNLASSVRGALAANLAELRKEENLTQAEFAAQFNYSDKAVSKWERGDSLPDVVMLKTIADLYGLRVDDLLTDGGVAAAYAAATESGGEKQHDAYLMSKVLIAAMWVTMVWVVAVVVFLYSQFSIGKMYWMAFVWAVPVSFAVAFLFSRHWEGETTLQCVFSSLFVWSTITAFYFQYLQYNIWAVFFVGVPVQIALILGTKLHRAGVHWLRR